ncbi:MAG: MSHA biogenesis protein MshN [Marinobacter sp.]|nr:MSHA biogenesis protein MshN [Marinobacter sp.]
MSLLNDALKAAEQRQNRPQISSAYTGQAQAQPATRSRLPLVLFLLVIVIAAGGGVWWWLTGQHTSETQEEPVPPVAETSEPEPAEPPEPQSVIAEPEPVTPVAEVIEPDEPEPEPAATSAKPETPAEPSPEAEPEPRVATQEPQAEEPAQPEPVAQKTEAPIDTASEEPEEPKPEASTAAVKLQRETPEAIDRRTSRELEEWLASGRTTEAEQRLTAITANQPAPESREAFAREMLVQQMPARALEWLPENLTKDHAGLRLLRARAQLEQGNLNLAVATLSSQVPPVEDGVEYRITLATLLQQAGKTDESAGHWSELIEYDDNQPTWWLGLAMALDAGGRANSAVRAYAQAVTMPGLSDNLVNYAKQRLQALQAGS